MTALDRPGMARDEIQRQVLGNYEACRSDAVTKAWSALSRREHRNTSIEELAGAYDREQVLVCDSCGLAYPASADAWTGRGHCDFDGGKLVEWNSRPPVESLEGRIRMILLRLAAGS